MRRFVIALLGATAMSAAANAADLPVKAPPYQPPPPFNWTGFYIGGYVGGAWGQDFNATDVDGYNAAGENWGYGNPSSFIGGGTIGYNWQPVGSPWVFGLEGEFGYLHLSKSGPDPLSPGLDTVADAHIGDWYGVFAGRLGYSWDHWLLYAKGGVAFTRVRASVVDACNTGACGADLINTSASEDRAGWALGGGLEYALNNNWSVKAEYLYLGVNQTLTSCGLDTAAGTQFCFDHEVKGVSTAKLGVNYRFTGY
jgi:outer membrane immunogenic protein